MRRDEVQPGQRVTTTFAQANGYVTATLPSEYTSRRQEGVNGTVDELVIPSKPAIWWISHDDGSRAPYSYDELVPEADPLEALIAAIEKPAIVIDVVTITKPAPYDAEARTVFGVNAKQQPASVADNTSATEPGKVASINDDAATSARALGLKAMVLNLRKRFLSL